MSRFTKFTSVTLPTLEDPLYRLTEDLVYERGYEGSWDFIIAPKGTETDFASLPFFVPFRRDDARWINPSIIHDALFGKAKTITDLQDANDIFYEAMLVCKTPKWIAICFYLAVSLYKYYYFLKVT